MEKFAFWQYIQEHWGKYLGLLGRHAQLTLLALGISILLGLGIGVLCYSSDRLAAAANTLVSALRVVPSIALLLLCMPLLGTGLVPALVALTILGLSPVVNSSVTALRGTDPRLLEAAQACGMEDGEIFRKIRWPLALPGIITGCRLAGLSVAAGATLAAYIGAGGLGELVLSGLSQFRYDMIFAGALSMIAVSLCVEGVFQILYHYVSRYRVTDS